MVPSHSLLLGLCSPAWLPGKAPSCWQLEAGQFHKHDVGRGGVGELPGRPALGAWSLCLAVRCCPDFWMHVPERRTTMNSSSICWSFLAVRKNGGKKSKLCLIIPFSKYCILVACAKVSIVVSEMRVPSLDNAPPDLMSKVGASSRGARPLSRLIAS